MKTCTNCKEEKPLEDFYKDSRTSSGRYSDCKPCVVKRNVEFRKVKPRPKRVYPKVAEKRPRDAAGYHRQRQLERPYEQKVHSQFNAAVKKGVIVRKPCEECGDERADGHHDDYNFPLKVRWLCRSHHRLWHRKNRPIYPINFELPTKRIKKGIWVLRAPTYPEGKTYRVKAEAMKESARLRAAGEWAYVRMAFLEPKP